jgi:hypothetical protein
MQCGGQVLQLSSEHKWVLLASGILVVILRVCVRRAAVGPGICMYGRVCVLQHFSWGLG